MKKYLAASFLCIFLLSNSAFAKSAWLDQHFLDLCNQNDPLALIIKNKVLASASCEDAATQVTTLTKFDLSKYNNYTFNINSYFPNNLPSINPIDSLSALQGLTNLQTLVLKNNVMLDNTKPQLPKDYSSVLATLTGLTDLTIDIPTTQSNFSLQFLSSLPHIKSLSLVVNYICSGPECALPNKTLKDWNTLSGQWSDLSGQIVKSLSVLKNVHSLQAIKLNKLQLSSDNFNQMVNDIAAQKNITRVTLENFTGINFPLDFTPVGKLKSVTNLDLASNVIGLNSGKPIAQLAFLKEMPQLVTLNLSNVIGEIDLSSFISQLHHLKTLIINSDLSTNIKSLKPLESIASTLSTLNISGTTITNGDYTPLGDLKNLKNLNIASYVDSIGSGEPVKINFNFLANLHKLKELNISVVPPQGKAASLLPLAGLTQLNDLVINGYGYDTSNLEPLSHLTNLQYLDIKWFTPSGVTSRNSKPMSLEFVKPLINLESYNAPEIVAESLMPFADHDKLKKLITIVVNADSSQGWQGLTALPTLPNLETLGVSLGVQENHEVNAQSFAGITPNTLPNLNTLNVSVYYYDITHPGSISPDLLTAFSSFGSSKTLKQFVFNAYGTYRAFTALQFVNLAPLVNLKNLQNLAILYPPSNGDILLSPIDLSSLGQLTQLKNLVIDTNELPIENESDLSNLKNLRALYISLDTQPTPNNLQTNYPVVLANLPNLQVFYGLDKLSKFNSYDYAAHGLQSKNYFFEHLVQAHQLSHTPLTIYSGDPSGTSFPYPSSTVLKYFETRNSISMKSEIRNNNRK